MKEIKKIKNLTPHDINLLCEDETLTLRSEGVLRLATSRIKVGEIEYNGKKINITKTKFSKIDDLPKREEGVIYIVSSLICQNYPERDDFYIVDDTVRDSDGRIIGARSISQNPFYRGESDE